MTSDWLQARVVGRHRHQLPLRALGLVVPLPSSLSQPLLMVLRLSSLMVFPPSSPTFRSILYRPSTTSQTRSSPMNLPPHISCMPILIWASTTRATTCSQLNARHCRRRCTRTLPAGPFPQKPLATPTSPSCAMRLTRSQPALPLTLRSTGLCSTLSRWRTGQSSRSCTVYTPSTFQAACCAYGKARTPISTARSSQWLPA